MKKPRVFFASNDATLTGDIVRVCCDCGFVPFVWGNGLAVTENCLVAVEMRKAIASSEILTLYINDSSYIEISNKAENKRRPIETSWVFDAIHLMPRNGQKLQIYMAQEVADKIENIQQFSGESIRTIESNLFLSTFTADLISSNRQH